MARARFAAFGLILAGGVAVAVSVLVAQAPATGERARARVMTLDGRGAHLGVVVHDLDAAALKAAGTTGGARIDEVDQDSPAAKAGLREGDIVVEVDGERVRSARQFARLIQETPEGRSVSLAIVRDGQRQTMSVTPETGAFGLSGWADLERGWTQSFKQLEPRLRELEPRLREFRFDGPLDFDFDGWRGFTSPRGRLGVQVSELSPQLAEYFGVTDGGVLVSSVTRESPAEKAGVKAGDVITSINGDRVRTTDDLVDGLRETDGQEVTIGLMRDRKETSLKATLEEKPRPLMRRPA